LDIYFGNEQNCLGKEQNSTLIMSYDKWALKRLAQKDLCDRKFQNLRTILEFYQFRDQIVLVKILDTTLLD